MECNRKSNILRFLQKIWGCFGGSTSFIWDRLQSCAPRHLLLKTLISSYCWGRRFNSQLLDMFYHGENHPRDMNAIRQNRSIPEYKRLLQPSVETMKPVPNRDVGSGTPINRLLFMRGTFYTRTNSENTLLYWQYCLKVPRSRTRWNPFSSLITSCHFLAWSVPAYW